jgi:hypothetical protein
MLVAAKVTSHRVIDIAGIVFIGSIIYKLYRLVYKPFKQQLHDKPTLMANYGSLQVGIVFIASP